MLTSLVDELHHVFVGRDDEDLVTKGCELAGESADDVIGFEAFVVEDGNAKGFECATDVGLLLDEVGWRFGAVGFVATVLGGFKLLSLNVELFDIFELGCELVAVDGSSYVVDRRKVLRLEVLTQLVDHVDEDIGGRGGDTCSRGHGPGALHGVIRAEDEGHAVEEVNWRLCLRGRGRIRLWCHWCFDGSAWQ